MINQGVTTALVARDANRSTNGDDSHISRGTKGVDGLSQWFKRMESVFYISNFGHDAAYDMPWKTLMKMMTEKYCRRNEIKKPEMEIWDLKTKSKRKFEDTSRNTQNQQQQQQNKRQNTGRAYTAGSGEKKPYEGSKPLCSKCNYHHDGPCAPKCHKCNKVGHFARDFQGHLKRECPKLKNNNNRGNQAGNGNAPAKVYA
ncbi:retrotransposon protein, putative, ty3-gypsy subclass, partial [Tanacetum coccineum]